MVEILDTKPKIEAEKLPVLTQERKHPSEFNLNDLLKQIDELAKKTGEKSQEVISQGDKRIESAILSIGADPGSITPGKLLIEPVQKEISKLAKDTEDLLQGQKSPDSGAGITNREPEKSVEVKQQTPEEIKEERRMGIIKEIEKEWEAKNGPMDRPLSAEEIEKNKEMARLWGKEWDGRTTQLIDAASEFFFDHKGMGKSSVPSKADKILAERFPEYAQKTERPPQNEQKKTEEKIPVAEVAKPTEKTPTDQLNSLNEERARILELKNMALKSRTEGRMSGAGLDKINAIHDGKLGKIEAEFRKVINESRIPGTDLKPTEKNEQSEKTDPQEAIMEAKDFESLANIVRGLKRIGEIKYSDGSFYKAEDVADVILDVGKGKLDPDKFVTRQLGLREKVHQLLTEKAIMETKDIKSLERVVRSLGKITHKNGHVYKAEEIAGILDLVAAGKIDPAYVTNTFGIRDKLKELMK